MSIVYFLFFSKYLFYLKLFQEQIIFFFFFLQRNLAVNINSELSKQNLLSVINLMLSFQETISTVHKHTTNPGQPATSNPPAISDATDPSSSRSSARAGSDSTIHAGSTVL